MQYSQNDRDAQIRLCQNQVFAHLLDNPDQASATSKITGHVADALKCTVRQGRQLADMDMLRTMGGDETAPSPSFFAKAGLVGYLAIATKMTAAREGLRFRSVDVEIETDSDTLAIFGLGGGNAAPLDTRVKVLIDTNEPADVVDDLIARVLTIDTWSLALRDPQSVSVDWERQEIPSEAPDTATSGEHHATA